MMTTSKKTTGPSANNAITLLTDDHEKVKKLFKDFEKLKEKGDAADKEALVEQICTELTMHTEIEEELFYPAARDVIDDEVMMNEAEVEHASAKDLIAQLQAMDSSDPTYNAKVTVLGEYVEHHVTEEEKEMFPKLKKTKLDLDELGEEITMLKEKKEMQMLGRAPNSSGSRNSSART